MFGQLPGSQLECECDACLYRAEAATLAVQQQGHSIARVVE